MTQLGEAMHVVVARFLILALLPGMGLALSACSSAAPPEDHFYRLQVDFISPPAERPTFPGVLEVARLDSDGVIVERPLVYTREDGVLARYRYDLWSDPPARLLHERMVEALALSKVSEGITVSELRNLSDWVVRGRLQRFEQVDNGAAVVVRLALAVSSARDGRVLLLDVYEVKEPTTAPTPEATAAALSRASTKAIADFIADLKALPVQEAQRKR